MHPRYASIPASRPVSEWAPLPDQYPATAPASGESETHSMSRCNDKMVSRGYRARTRGAVTGGAGRGGERERKAEMLKTEMLKKGGAELEKRYPEARLERQLGNKTVDI